MTTPDGADVADLRVGHIGVVVRDMVAATNDLLSLFGLGGERQFTQRAVHYGPGPTSTMDMTFVEAPGLLLELMQPTSDGAVMSFLEARGEGVHHVGLHSARVRHEWARQRDSEVRPLGKTPAVDGNGVSFWFLDPRVHHGVLWEVLGDWTRNGDRICPLEPDQQWS